jgi:hypothetical protein
MACALALVAGLAALVLAGDQRLTPPPKDNGKADEESRKAAKLAADLVSAKGKERKGLLEKLRDTKGAAYTEALAAAIPKLEGKTKKLAREALADRLTRLKAKTLKDYLKDKDAEIRRAAAIGVGHKVLDENKDATALVPDVIDLLDDKVDFVRIAARAALKAVAGKDLGEKPEPWREWWEKQAK